MASIEVNAQGVSYQIVARSGLLESMGEHIGMFANRRAAIISDENVAPLYAGLLQEQLKKSAVSSVLLTVTAGENSKSNEQCMRLYGQLWEYGITRGDFIIALGGGVVGDLAGYAAATYLRGVPLIQIPTTLLAQVDSSVGGKVAINLPQGKNLVGAFSQPALVLADSDVLASLDARQQRAGMAEIVKYGCIADAEMLEFLEEGDAYRHDMLSRLVIECCAIKADYVEKDPLDKGVRMELNFGHTLGHAIEAAAGYGEVLHGEGVAIGMVAAAQWGETLGVSPDGTCEYIRQLLQKLGLPTVSPVRDIQALGQAMLGDKKADGGEMNLVLLERLGKARVVRIAKEKLLELIVGYLP